MITFLSEKKKHDHLKFARHFRNNWGLGKGKLLLLMYDEKCFWVLVTRIGAKSYKYLGVKTKSFQAYTKIWTLV